MQLEVNSLGLGGVLEPIVNKGILDYIKNNNVNPSDIFYAHIEVKANQIANLNGIIYDEIPLVVFNDGIGITELEGNLITATNVERMLVQLRGSNKTSGGVIVATIGFLFLLFSK